MTLEDEAAQTQMPRMTRLNLEVLCTHKLTCVLATPPKYQINLLPLRPDEHRSRTDPPRPPANHPTDLLIEERVDATASCLI